MNLIDCRLTEKELEILLGIAEQTQNETEKRTLLKAVNIFESIAEEHTRQMLEEYYAETDNKIQANILDSDERIVII